MCQVLLASTEDPTATDRRTLADSLGQIPFSESLGKKSVESKDQFLVMIPTTRAALS
jgi:hypothetical protein